MRSWYASRNLSACASENKCSSRQLSCSDFLAIFFRSARYAPHRATGQPDRVGSTVNRWMYCSPGLAINVGEDVGQLHIRLRSAPVPPASDVGRSPFISMSPARRDSARKGANVFVRRNVREASRKPSIQPLSQRTIRTSACDLSILHMTRIDQEHGEASRHEQLISGIEERGRFDRKVPSILVHAPSRRLITSRSSASS